MSNMSDYLESGLIDHLLRGGTFAKPVNISVALTSSVPADSDTGASMPELPSGINGSGTGYSRVDLGPPSASGNGAWTYNPLDAAAGSGVTRNATALTWGTALVDMGWVSGVAVCDSATHSAGNMLFYVEVDNPRVVYTGDSLKFNISGLAVNLK